MRERVRSFLLASLFWALLSPTAGLAAGHVEAMLVSEVASVQAGTPFWVAVRLKMEQGWHTYWQNPGDSGQATQVRWSLPPGFSAGPIRWPYPSRIETPPLVSLGYEGEAALLTQITPASQVTGSPVELGAQAEWLECKDVCIPGKAKLRLTLPIAAAPARGSPDWSEWFKQARALLPIELDRSAASGLSATALSDGSDLSLILEGEDHDGQKTHVFPLQPGLLDLSRAPLTQTLPRKTKLDFALGKRAKGVPERFDAVVVFEDQKRAVTFSIPVAQTSSLWRMVFFAFLGGLILNLMPCVFPVLSIKILSFVSHGEQDSRKIRMHGLVFTAGVFVSFWSLLALLLLFRAAGEQLGWGFQLQSPLFPVFLACLFFLFGFNMLGAFEVGTSFMGMGSSLTSKGGYTGAFFTGILATVVATPCTAPFMGAALGFALSQKPLIAFTVFTSLATGMALPYLVFSASPAALHLLPRPGRWMESLKQFLAFPLFATVIWLLWVLGLQTGPSGVSSVLGGFLFFGIAIWIPKRWSGRIAQLAACAAFLLGATVAVNAGRMKPPAGQASAATQQTGGLEWKPYSEAALSELKVQGKPVFLDFTAAWCVTCQVNEQVVLNSPDVQASLKSHDVVLMRADWTTRDPAITEKLSELKRSGVPVYVLYRPESYSEPVVFPELLTSAMLLRELADLEHK